MNNILEIKDLVVRYIIAPDFAHFVFRNCGQVFSVIQNTSADNSARRPLNQAQN